MDENNIQVGVSCTLPCLRLMYKLADKAYQNWPGGDPKEQKALEKLKNSLYVCLMEATLDLN